MVKKLLKHEFIYYVRSFVLFLPIVLIIAVMRRIADAIDGNRVVHDLALGSATFMLVVSCAALLTLSFVAAVVRFYKNMYTAEGYLTFTLPVTNEQHIFVKLFTGIVCMAVCALTVLVAVLIALPFEDLAAFFRDLGEMFGSIIDDTGVLNTVVYVAEVLIILVLYAAYGLLLVYGCITVGQTAKKHRILKAIGAYYVYHIARQTLGTVLSIILITIEIPDTPNVSVEVPEIAARVGNIIAVHIVLVGVILFFAVICAVLWAITQHIMTKKLNLE